MTLKLYAHPFSSYCQKAITALYENDTPFELKLLDNGPNSDELAALWPIRRFPVLMDGEQMIPEASIIIEHLETHHPGPTKLIPADPDLALQVRLMDRIFDNYVSSPQQTVVFDSLRAEGEHDTVGVARAREQLEVAYAWLDKTMAGRTWAVGESFTLADCGAAPFLFYADWTHRIDPGFTHVHAYRRRLLARPSFARAVDEARPYRHFFPLGDPGRD
jgi:glutathione S-transferase